MKKPLTIAGLTLLALAIILVPTSLAAPTWTTGAISGVVFFDGNGNGVQDPGESGIQGVPVQVSGVSGSALTDANGVYSFIALPASSYTVTAVNLPGYVSTTPDSVPVSVGNNSTTTVSFGDATPIQLAGTVFDDVNKDGFQALTGEIGLPDALIQVFADNVIVNGVIDPNEPLLSSAVSDAQGNYSILGLAPGNRVVRISPPAGASASNNQVGGLWQSSELGGNTQYLNFPLSIADELPATLSGIIWNDVDGDEIIDDDEGKLSHVQLHVYFNNSVIATLESNDAGYYQSDPLAPGVYNMEIVLGSLPLGWIGSFDDSDLTVALGSDQQVGLNLGFFDPQAVAPMRVSDWKREFKRGGHPTYTSTQIDTFVASAEAASSVFPEIEPLRDALLKPERGEAGRVRKELAALRLNLAAGRLLVQTPISLLQYTTANTVGAAVAEIEAILAGATVSDSEYWRLHGLAESLNKGKGIGYGLSSKASVYNAIYKGKQVANVIVAQGGGEVDAVLGNPVYIRSWKIGPIDGSTNVLNAELRVLVKVFYDGAVVEARQYMPDGREVILGRAVPQTWNKDVRALYTFYLRDATTVQSLANTEIRLYVIDPDNDGGPVEHAKIDSAEILFGY